MNQPSSDSRCSSPDNRQQDKSTLKVHLPNGCFNLVKYGDAIDIKVSLVIDYVFLSYTEINLILDFLNYDIFGSIMPCLCRMSHTFFVIINILSI